MVFSLYSTVGENGRIEVAFSPVGARTARTLEAVEVFN